MTDHLRSQQRDRDLLTRAEQERDGDDKGWPGKSSLTAGMTASSGSALPTQLRGELEASLKTDLGGVRVHTDAGAERAAGAVHAKAFTLGQKIFFNRGFFNPGSQDGRRLLAHEVAHTVQQRGATVGADAQVSTPGDSHEQEAESFGDAFVSRVTSGGGSGSGAGAGPASGGTAIPGMPSMPSGPQMRAQVQAQVQAQVPRMPSISAVSRGILSRAVIQRDLLDGNPPAGLTGGESINARQPSPAELTEHARTAIRNARGGGVNSVVTTVRQLRGAATGSTSGAIEAAVNSELTDPEKQALNGNQNGGTNTGGNNPANHTPERQHGGANGGVNANARTNGNANANANGGANGGANANGGGHGGEHANANGNANAGANGGGPGGANGEANTEGGARTAGRNNNGQPRPGAENGGGERTAGHAGGEHAGGEHGGEHAGGEREERTPEARAAAIPPAAGRELIEAELSFHERWRAYAAHDQDGVGNRFAAAGSRMMQLGSGLGNDVGQGMYSGAMQYVMGAGVKFLTTDTMLGRIPGVGNIIGGGFAAYNLFAHGGAGIREMGHEAMEGIGGAFSASNWRESPFLTAANLISGIKAVLEIVGNVCQILSGLAYAFAAIAALGGLLSFLFPPLAFLLPYIPMALQFGRACGGIATIALSVATGLSPIPPILRAIHIIFSSQDPIKLVAEEQKFHKEAQGAISNYTSSRLSNAQRVNEGGSSRGFYAGLQNEIHEGATTARTSMNSGSTGRTEEALGTSNPELQNARTEAVVGGDTRNAQRAGANYFNPDSRSTVNTERREGAETELEGREHRRDKQQTSVDRAIETRDANNTRANRRSLALKGQRLDKAEARVAESETRVENAEMQQDIGGRNGMTGAGNSGDVGPAAIDRSNSFREEARVETANDAAREMNEGNAAPEAQRNARGHVQLPEPPGSLQEIDQLDQRIEQMRQAEQAMTQQATRARAQQHRAQQSATGLTTASAGVQAHIAQNQTRGAAAQQRVVAQTTDIQSRTGQANQQAGGQTQQAAGSLTAIASGARTLDGFLGRVPSNRFFDVSGTRNNVHQFVLGMDQVTGSGPQQQQQNSQAQAGIAQRTQQTQQASQANQAGVQAGQQVHALMTQDAGTARTAAQQAGENAASTQQHAQTTAAQIQQLQQQRTARWAALMQWAAQHRQLRSQNAEGGGHE